MLSIISSRSRERLATRPAKAVLSALLAVGLIGSLASATAWAQFPQRGFRNRPLFQRPLVQQLLQPQLEIELVAGEPYGVGRAQIPLTGAGKDADAQALATVSDRMGRIVYPAYESTPVRQIIREVVSAPRRTTVYFLFRGAEPLEMTQPVQQTLAPRSDPAAHARLLGEWWRQYASREQKMLDPNEGPTEVRDYLTWMLSRRLNLPNPLAGGQPVGGAGTQALSLVTGGDAMRKQILQEVLAGGASESANLPLPPALAPPTLPGPPPADKIAIEPIAEHVPAECLYVRFGSFTNFLWLRERLASVQGQLQNFAFERGIDTDNGKQIETQLVARQVRWPKRSDRA